MIKVEVKYDSHEAAYAQRIKALQGGFGPFVRGVAVDNIETIARYTPGYPNGTMSKSYIVVYSGQGLDLQGRVYNTQHYFWIVIKGRKKIDQRAAGRNKPLRFVIGNQVLFRWSVGPAAPNNFIERANKEVLDRAEQKTIQFRNKIMKIGV